MKTPLRSSRLDIGNIEANGANIRKLLRTIFPTLPLLGGFSNY